MIKYNPHRRSEINEEIANLMHMRKLISISFWIALALFFIAPSILTSIFGDQMKSVYLAFLAYELIFWVWGMRIDKKIRKLREESLKYKDEKDEETL